MVSLKTNEEMIAYWKGHGFGNVVLVDAKAFDDAHQQGDYVDSTRFTESTRYEFSRTVLSQMKHAADSAMNGQLTVFIIKQLKGAGVHAEGAKSHNLYPGDSFENPKIAAGLQKACIATTSLATGA